MKVLRFLGDSHRALCDFPKDARQNAGRQLLKVQRDDLPDDFKPMSDVGKGVEEIRIWEESGTFRVMYVARLVEAVYVLHAFQKKSPRGVETRQSDVALVRARLRMAQQDYEERYG